MKRKYLYTLISIFTVLGLFAVDMFLNYQEKVKTFITRKIDEKVHNISENSTTTIDNIKISISKNFFKFNVKLENMTLDYKDLGMQIYIDKIHTSINWMNILSFKQTEKFSNFVIHNMHISLAEMTDKNYYSIHDDDGKSIINIMKEKIKQSYKFPSNIDFSIECKQFLISETNNIFMEGKAIISPIQGGISVEIKGQKQKKEFSIYGQFIDDDFHKLFLKFNNFNFSTKNIIKSPNDGYFDILVDGSTYAVLNENTMEIVNSYVGIKNIIIEEKEVNSDPLNITGSNIAIEFDGTHLKSNLAHLSLNEEQTIDGKFYVDINDIEKINAELQIPYINIQTLGKYLPNNDEYKIKDWIQQKIKKGFLQDINLKLKFNTLLNKIKILDMMVSGNMQDTEINIIDNNDEVFKIKNSRLSANKQTLTINEIEGSFYENEVLETTINIDNLQSPSSSQIYIRGKSKGEAHNIYKAFLKNKNTVSEKIHLENVRGDSESSFYIYSPLNDFSKLYYEFSSEIQKVNAKGLYHAFDIDDGEILIRGIGKDITLDGRLTSSEGNNIEVFANIDNQFNTAEYKINGIFDIEKVKQINLIPNLDNYIKIDGMIETNLKIDKLQNNDFRIKCQTELKDSNVSIQKLDWNSNGERGNINIDIVNRGDIFEINNIEIDTQNLSISSRGLISPKKMEIYFDKIHAGPNKISVTYANKVGIEEVKVSGSNVVLNNVFDLLKQSPSKDYIHRKTNVDIQSLNINGVIIDDFSLNMKCKDVGTCIPEINGKLQNGKVITGKYVEGSGIQIYTNDTGTLMNAMSFQDIQSGITTLYIKEDDRGNISGHARIKNVYLTNAPVLAKILSLASLPFGGITNVISKKGLLFYNVSIPFKYSNRTIAITDLLAESDSIGVKLSGKINPEGKFLFKGSVIPAYALSKIIWKIPIIGKTITGGDKEGLIAANYQIEGTRKDYTVKVNTLSIVAPGVLRKFFSFLYKDKNPDNEIDLESEQKK